MECLEFHGLNDDTNSIIDVTEERSKDREMFGRPSMNFTQIFVLEVFYFVVNINMEKRTCIQTGNTFLRPKFTFTLRQRHVEIRASASKRPKYFFNCSVFGKQYSVRCLCGIYIMEMYMKRIILYLVLYP